MMDIYYVNSRNEKLDFLGNEYSLQTGDFFDYSWAYNQNNNRIDNFFREIQEKSMLLSIRGRSRTECYENINHFSATTEIDLLTMTPGHLFVGQCSMQCYIQAGRFSDWEDDIACVDCEITILTDAPVWIKEISQSYHAFANSSTKNKKYPGKYAYRYVNGMTSSYVINDHFSDADFVIRIYGPVINPQVTIGGCPYLVNIVLENGERLEIDSRNRTIVKYLHKGTQISVFHCRQKGRLFFRKIPPGRNEVSWTGKYDFDLILYAERSEPEW